jgi:hypothetical protein
MVTEMMEIEVMGERDEIFHSFGNDLMESGSTSAIILRNKRFRMLKKQQ